METDCSGHPGWKCIGQEGLRLLLSSASQRFGGPGSLPKTVPRERGWGGDHEMPPGS